MGSVFRTSLAAVPLLLCFFLSSGLLAAKSGYKGVPVTVDCSNFSQAYVDEIASYAPLLQNFTDLILTGAFKGVAYTRLAEFVDRFGSRLFGSQNLEDSIDYVLDQLQSDGLPVIKTENVSFVPWIRGEESLNLVAPHARSLAVLGLGSSVGTPPEGITADVLVVQTFDELNAKADQVPGKIVVFNQQYFNYSESVKYRNWGASNAARLGAVAALVRSVTPYSIYSPHTGQLNYAPDIVPIPGASITVEDAELFQRFSDRGETITVTLVMGASLGETSVSRNIIADYIGDETPLDFVYVTGHIDSWDVGQGAMDDGGGAFISLLTPVVYQQLELIPRRTVRTILWTGEEFGFVGANQYLLDHSGEFHHIDVVLESDGGTFKPLGYQVSATHDAACIFQEVLKLTAPLGASTLEFPDDGSDETIFAKNGLPAADLLSSDEDYYNYHHSNGDTMTVINSDELDQSLAFYAFTSYVIADLSFNVPHQKCATKNGC